MMRRKKKLIVNPTIGCDIEVFFRNKNTGEPVSAEPFIKGTKYDPFVFDPSSQYHAVSLDNVAAEFCIPPVTDKVKFFEYITKSLNYLQSTIPDYLVVSPIP